MSIQWRRALHGKSHNSLWSQFTLTRMTRSTARTYMYEQQQQKIDIINWLLTAHSTAEVIPGWLTLQVQQKRLHTSSSITKQNKNHTSAGRRKIREQNCCRTRTPHTPKYTLNAPLFCWAYKSSLGKFCHQPESLPASSSFIKRPPSSMGETAQK